MHVDVLELAALKSELNLHGTLDPLWWPHGLTLLLPLKREKLSSSVWPSLKRAGKLITCSTVSVREFKGSLYHLQPVLFLCNTFQAFFFFWFFSSHTLSVPHLLGKAGLGFPADECFHPDHPLFPFEVVLRFFWDAFGINWLGLEGFRFRFDWSCMFLKMSH